jgi:hypothetical protein
LTPFFQLVVDVSTALLTALLAVVPTLNRLSRGLCPSLSFLVTTSFRGRQSSSGPPLAAKTEVIDGVEVATNPRRTPRQDFLRHRGE